MNRLLRRLKLVLENISPDPSLSGRFHESIVEGWLESGDVQRGVEFMLLSVTLMSQRQKHWQSLTCCFLAAVAVGRMGSLFDDHSIGEQGLVRPRS